MTILAVDFGERRIGLAVSDPERRMALPVGSVERRSDSQALEEITKIASDRQAEAFVVGEPLTLEGNRGSAAERCRRFALKLERRTGLPVTLVTETLTTHEAELRLREAKPGRKAGRKVKEHLDATAAQIILQEELDRQRSSCRLP